MESNPVSISISSIEETPFLSVLAALIALLSRARIIYEDREIEEALEKLDKALEFEEEYSLIIKKKDNIDKSSEKL